MRCGQQVDEWYVFENHRTENVSVFGLEADACAKVVRCHSFSCE